jgi:hypothetical protein
MAQSIRQRNLFAAEDFRIVYDSFKQANFKAYDYDTIRGAMVDYIQTNYPENFNDWIQSSEFVALVELMAFLGHSLAFRVDLASRENFLSTAERRASILRISDFLGYSAARSVPAKGLLKIQSIKTNQPLFDVAGNTLRNAEVQFVDEQNPNSYQNFLLILNEVLYSTNKFGRPTSSSRIDGIQTETYAANMADNQDVVFKFRALVNGTHQTFEMHSNYIDQADNILRESTPTPNSNFQFVYKNDQQGIASPDTGFFVGFKQGTLQYSDFNADKAISNLTIDVGAQRVNNSDVWVQNVDTDGSVIKNWTKVDSTFGTSAMFNSITNKNRDLYSVTTLDNDNIAVKFGDGVYADIPRGIVRTWYRTGLNETYTLNPEDVATVSFSFDYIGRDGNTYTVGFKVRLEDTVSTASSRETVKTIKENAGRVFETQDRMITAEDYSVFPLTASENIRKLKSINRTHSGHSRFIDINDPTAQYQTVNTIVDDGYIYSENTLDRIAISLPTDLSETILFRKYIKDIIKNPEVINLFYKEYEPIDVFSSNINQVYKWQQETASNNTSTGFFTQANIIQRIGPSMFTNTRHIQVGSIIEFEDSSGNTMWSRVTDVFQDGLGVDNDSGQPSGRNTNGRGAVTLSNIVPNNVSVKRIFPGYNTNFSDTEIDKIITELSNKTSFGLRFDSVNGQWKIVKGANLPDDELNGPQYFDLETAGAGGTLPDQSWIIRIDYSADKWTILTRRFRLVFGSEKEIRFYNQNNKIKFNEETNKPDRDTILIYGINTKAESNEMLGRDIPFYIYKYYATSDGYTNDKVVILTMSNVNNDLYPENPMAFKELTEIPNDNPFIPPTYSYIAIHSDPANPEHVGDNCVKYSPSIYYPEDDVISEDEVEYAEGRSDLVFLWKRIADHNQRIDPSISNVIDIFVLTNNYDTLYRDWLANDRDENNEPLAPTTEELDTQFANIDHKRSVSDSLIYRSAEYKPLFGDTADTELQAKFRVVKVRGTTLTDSEIQSKVAEAVEEFFNVDNWDFGETFYFTELSTHIHNRLAGIISSVVIVPLQENSVFGNLFQITPETHEIFIPDVTATNIEIVDNLTAANLRTA